MYVQLDLPKNLEFLQQGQIMAETSNEDKNAPKKLSKKELNKLKRKEAKKKGKQNARQNDSQPTGPFCFQGITELLSKYFGVTTPHVKAPEAQLSTARLLCRMNPNYNIYPLLSPQGTFEVDILLDFFADERSTPKALTETFEKHFEEHTFLVAEKLSLADFALCSYFYFHNVDLNIFVHLKRWRETLPEMSKQTRRQPAQGTKGKKVKGPSLPDLHHLDTIKGKVTTRFPPEPSGHLHIGHCKALFLNQYYKEKYAGNMLFRFDDTNPSKEKEEYENGIVNDLITLGFDVSKVTHTSDYFKMITEHARTLIKKGLAYMDNSSPEVMKTQRDQGEDSVCRVYDAEKNMELFEAMLVAKKPKDGDGEKWCLRAKIDMQSKNKTLRDPVLYRQSDPHPRTGSTACPTYDLACPIVDSVEGVTHALRDMNYKDRIPLYKWVLESLELRDVHLHDFSRMNFVHTIMSKRKLKWCVEEGLVDGWNDPRFPTVKGILRRGLQVQALKDYMVSQGASRKIADIEWDKLWNLNKKLLDPVVPRFMAVGREPGSTITLKLTNFKQIFASNGNSKIGGKYIPKHPKDKNGEKFGNKFLACTEKLILEKGDFDLGTPVKVGEQILLLQLGVVELSSIKGGELEGNFIPNGDVSKPERKVHWLAEHSALKVPARIWEYDHLLTKPILGPEDDFKDFLNKQSLATTEVWGSQDLRNLKKGDCCQLLRRGYFRVDKSYSDAGVVELVMIPDGKQKSVSSFSAATDKISHK
eukprot:maker-scaffold_1-snap-gene-29.39-mRNA-1 protein AED:0.01 eAED:0.01 QI:0/0/0.5/0.5/0/0/2/40/755